MDIDMDEPQMDESRPSITQNMPVQSKIQQLVFNEPQSPEIETLNLQPQTSSQPPIFFDPNANKKTKHSLFNKNNNVEPLKPTNSFITPNINSQDPIDSTITYTAPKSSTKYYHEDDNINYDDKFPITSDKMSKFVSTVVIISSACLAIGFFIPIFAVPITYSLFWTAFFFVSIHVSVIIASCKAKHFYHWCHKNCRVLIRRQYLLFIQAICIQLYPFYFQTNIIGMVVGSALILLGAFFTALGLIGLVVGAIKNRV
ncbi:Transmembrane domain-containing protein [Spironucleus salmonicida]|uniref:Transmembrane domain-containing protein n=1 Tax=Spironucleus salmonicida TaxID=348837 RepID=V6LK78_9EUKA|nr:Transmembrane domain-containing protein [Spironucleus salmonicida]|eukprot:EST44146.1 Transmembrane domain-containing protein [Spironucleus salmonicida]